MIDTHCHLDFPIFDDDREDVLLRSKKVGVQGIVVPGVLQEHWRRIAMLCSDKQGVELFAAYGLHPCFVHHHGAIDTVSDVLHAQLENEKAVAVGEIGLDFFSDLKTKSIQLTLFEAQLRVAKEKNLPVLLHVRKAHDDALKRLRMLKLDRGGIVHAFSGSEQQAKQYIDLGFMLGIGGVVTYDRAKKLHRVVGQSLLQNLVLETDAPDLPPCKFRHQRNSPEHLRYIAEAIAIIKGVDVSEVIKTTTFTAEHLLQWQ